MAPVRFFTRHSLQVPREPRACGCITWNGVHSSALSAAYRNCVLFFPSWSSQPLDWALGGATVSMSIGMEGLPVVRGFVVLSILCFSYSPGRLNMLLQGSCRSSSSSSSIARMLPVMSNVGTGLESSERNESLGGSQIFSRSLLSSHSYLFRIFFLLTSLTRRARVCVCVCVALLSPTLIVSIFWSSA